MWLCLLVVCIFVVCSDKLFPVSYNVREPNSFNAIFNGTKVKFSLLDSEYPEDMISNGYMSGGQGKLTDGIVGQALLPHHDVTAENSSWVAWVFRGSDETKDRNLIIYFQFDEDVLIESILVNILSQGLTETVATYVYSVGLVQLLQEDNSTVVGSVSVYPTSRRNPGIRKENLMLQSCQPARIVRIEFHAGETRRLVFGEIQFEGEPAVWMDFSHIGHPKPGTRLVLPCFSDKANVTIYRDGKKVDCDVTRTADNRYNCTVTKERFGFTDSANYVCFAYPSNGRCQSQPLSKSLYIAPNKGIYADVLERRVSLSSVTNLSCHSQNVIARISFQKSYGGTTVDIADSPTHTLSINITPSVSVTTLIFLNVSKADAGVYRCRVVDPGTTNEFFSQNMTLSISYEATQSVPTELPDGPSSSTLQISVPTLDLTPSLTILSAGSSGLGIGVLGGIIAAVLLILLTTVLVFIFLVWRKHRRNVKRGTGDDVDGNTDVECPYETPQDSPMVTYTDSAAYVAQRSAVQRNISEGLCPLPDSQGPQRTEMSESTEPVEAGVCNWSEAQGETGNDSSYETPMGYTKSRAYVSTEDTFLMISRIDQPRRSLTQPAISTDRSDQQPNQDHAYVEVYEETGSNAATLASDDMQSDTQL